MNLPSSGYLSPSSNIAGPLSESDSDSSIGADRCESGEEFLEELTPSQQTVQCNARRDMVESAGGKK